MNIRELISMKDIVTQSHKNSIITQLKHTHGHNYFNKYHKCNGCQSLRFVIDSDKTVIWVECKSDYTEGHMWDLEPCEDRKPISGW